MTPEEEAYEKALRHIREAEETGALELDLSGLEELTRLPPEMERLTSLQSLDLTGCRSLRGDLSTLASLTALQSLNFSNCYQLGDDLSPLAGLTSLQSLNLERCHYLRDLSPLVGLTSLRSLDLKLCSQVRRFSPIETLLPTLERLVLSGCNLDDLPPEVCDEWGDNENVRDKVRSYYHALRQIFISYAWGDISPNASEVDRQRQEVVEGLCGTLDKENWKVIRDKGALDYGDQISGFMKTLGEARLVIVVLSDKYLRSPYCMTELYSVYQNARQERQEFLNRIIPLVLKDANIGNWRGRATYAEHWETEFKAMERHLTRLGEEDLKLYKAMRRWHNEVGDMLAYVNDTLHPHGFDAIVKDDFAGLRQMLERHRAQMNSDRSGRRPEPPIDYKGYSIEEEHGLFAVRFYQSNPDLTHDFKPWCASVEEAKAVVDKLVARTPDEDTGSTL
jgi:TIR domain/Leucine Rich repeats (2 copies)